MSELGDGAAEDFSRPYVPVFCACEPFSAEHSVASGILAHCVLLSEAGYTLRILLPEGHTVEPLGLPAHTRVCATLPPPEASASTLETAFAAELERAAFAITHDIFLLDALASYRETVTLLARRSRKLRWFHWLHSLPPAQLTKSRRPSGGVYVVPTDASRAIVATRFQCSFDAIAVVPHVLPLSRLIADPDALELAELTDSAGADVVQIFPASAERLEAKGLPLVLRLFGELVRLGVRVRLIVATSRSDTATGLAQIRRVKELAALAGLTPPSVMFTADLASTWQRVFPRRAVMEFLAKVTNLFVFPSISETSALVVLEAAAGKNLLILNESLPMMREQLGASALYVPFGSVLAPGREPDLALLASQILDVLWRDRALAAHRRIWSAFSPREVSRQLLGVLERREEGSEGVSRHLSVLIWGEKAREIQDEDLAALWPGMRLDVVARAPKLSGRLLREAAVRALTPWLAVVCTEVAVPKTAAQALIDRVDAGAVAAVGLHPIFRSESPSANAQGTFVAERQYLGLDLCVLRTDLVRLCDGMQDDVDALALQIARRMNAIGGKIETCTTPYCGKPWSRPALAG